MRYTNYLFIQKLFQLFKVTLISVIQYKNQILSIYSKEVYSLRIFLNKINKCLFKRNNSCLNYN